MKPESSLSATAIEPGPPVQMSEHESERPTLQPTELARQTMSILCVLRLNYISVPTTVSQLLLGHIQTRPTAGDVILRLEYCLRRTNYFKLIITAGRV